jgi:Domain of unknown function DUF11
MGSCVCAGASRRLRRPGLVLLVATVTVGAVILSTSTAAADEVPTADLVLVSKSADVRHAKVGDEVTFTIIATNNGPDAADFNVFEDLGQIYPGRYPPSDFELVSEECDRGISADTPSCEYGTVQPGDTVTTIVVMRLKPVSSKYASNTACVISGYPINDPNPANDCVTIAVRVVGRRGD